MKKRSMLDKDMSNGLVHSAAALVNEDGQQEVLILINRHYQIFAQNVVQI